MWYNAITYGGRPTGSQRIHPRYRSLFKHPSLPGLLLKEVSSFNDLKSNCQGFMIFKGARFYGGAVGFSTQRYYNAGPVGTLSIQLPTTIKGTTPNFSDPYGLTRSSNWGLMTTPDVTYDCEGLRERTAVLSPVCDKPQFSVLQGYLRGTAAPTGGVGAIGYACKGHIATPGGSQTISSYIADVSTYSVVGIVSNAEDGRFCFPQKFDYADDPTNRIYSDSVDSGTPLYVPMNFGWLATEFALGTVGQALEAARPMMLDTAPSDAKEYIEKALNAYINSAPGKAVVTFRFMSSFDMIGYVGLWRVAHGIPMVTMGALDANATNMPSLHMIQTLRPQAMDAYSTAFDSVRVHPVGGLTADSVFMSLSNGHCMALGLDGASDKILPWPTGGTKLSKAIKDQCHIWLASDFLLSNQRTTLPTGNVAPEATTYTSLSSLNADTLQHLSNWSNSIVGSPGLVKIHKAVVEVYKLAEEYAKGE